MTRYGPLLVGPQGDFLPGYVHPGNLFLSRVAGLFFIVASIFPLDFGVVESLVILVAVVIRGTI